MIIKDMISYIKGGIQAKGIWKQDPEVNILAQEGCEWGVEKSLQWETSYYVSFRVIIYRKLRWAGHVDRMEEGRSTFNILTGKPTGKTPLGRPRRRWGTKLE